MLCCEEEFLPKHYAEAGRASFFKAISTLQLSPVIFKELRMALSRRKKKSAVPAGSRSTAPGGGAGTPNKHQDSLRASAKRTSWQARATHPSLQTGVQRLAKGPRLCPRVHRQSQSNKLHLAAGNSFRPRLRRRTRCFSWVRRPVSAKWVALADSHGFRPVCTRCLFGGSQ